MPPLMSTPFEGWPVGFDRLYGLELLSYSDEEVRAQVKVRDELRQPAGLVHGGVFASIAEALASMATWRGRARAGQSAQGLSNPTSFLRPIIDGTIHAVARRRHRGRTTWVWEVEITDDAGPPVRARAHDDRRQELRRAPTQPRYAFVIGIRRSRPNARVVILIPGGAWRRLYSARSTSAITRSTPRSGRPAARAGRGSRSCST